MTLYLGEEVIMNFLSGYDIVTAPPPKDCKNPEMYEPHSKLRKKLELVERTEGAKPR